MKNVYLILLGLLLPVHVVWCQSAIAYLGTDKGLSNDFVTAIFQDKDGFMWFGTSNGLNRYDGYEFKVFKNEPLSNNTIPDNRVTAIAESASAQLYVATKSGLAVIDANRSVCKQVLVRSQRENKLLNFPIHQIEKDMLGQLFLQGGSKGLFKIEETKDGSIATRIPLPYAGQKDFDYRVSAICKAADAGIWAIIDHLGLAYYDSKKKSFSIVKQGDFQSTTMAVSAIGDVWFANYQKINCYHIKTGVFDQYKYDTYRKAIVNLYFGKDKKLWICTDGAGIQKFNTTTQTFEEYIGFDQKQLTSRSVFAVWEDKDDRIWIGTLRGGVNIVDPVKRRFQSFKLIPNSQRVNTTDFILSFEQADRDHIWIGTDGDGLYKWSISEGHLVNYTYSAPMQSKPSFITSLLQHQNDQLWIGTYDMGIVKLNTKTGDVKHYSCYYPNTPYANNAVWRLFKDSRGTFWASTLASGNVYRLDTITDQFKYLDLPINDVLTFYEDKDATLWMGSWNSLFRLDLRTMKYKSYQIGTPIRFIQQTENGFLWLGTEGGGLLHLNLNTMNYRRYTEKDGLVSNTLLNSLQDAQGNMWISSLDGLSKLDLRKKTFQNFYQSDGLQSNQFNYNAAIKLHDNQLIFGGIRGFNIIRPKDVLFKTRFPALKLTRLSIDNMPYDQSGQERQIPLNEVKRLKIPFDKAVLSFSYAALDFSFSDRIDYAYYLEGWDKDWNYVNKQRTAYYSNLREGTYKLHIRSTNANGEWNPAERIIEIEVLPPWYRSFWAYLGYFLLLAAVLYFYNRYRENKALLLFKVKTAEFERDKEHELLEDKLAFFTHIVHEIRTPLTLIVNPIKDIVVKSKKNMADSDELLSIYNHSKRLLNLADKLLLFRKSDGNLDELSSKVFDIIQVWRDAFESFKQLASARNITYSFETTIEKLIINADNEKLEICFINLLQNALKYTDKGGSVTVKVNRIKSELICDIIDSGQGCPTHLTEEIFKPFKRNFNLFNQSADGFGIGLFFVKKFITLHEGKLEYTANPKAGATFTIRLPIHQVNSTTIDATAELQQASSRHLASAEEDKREHTPSIYSKKRQPLDEWYGDGMQEKILIVDDNEDMLNYIAGIFSDKYEVIKADSAEMAITVLEKIEPSIVISDIMMGGDSGIDLCKHMKSNTKRSHVPIILLTASSSFDVKLKGIEVGADDYIVKPFDKELLVARVESLIENKNRLHTYFYSEITLQSKDHQVPTAFKDFLQRAIAVVEKHLLNENFTVKMLADELGMSHSNMYRRIKSISGKSANEFIRYIRMRRAAQLLISNKTNINETAYQVGFKDIKHFRQHFSKIFGCSPSEYRKRYSHLGNLPDNIS
ncbi:two-component regulator propeller domain-containing protein [Sphingobacterium sp.]|uniref:hybrid sensor histidine kinase/response regulator transcription factor n=1 Tax=Sphingobacterium sp. TaxID=341027 RepID=UPI0028A215C4|nr:two-component regulator propeller domain-containing protein [Sphingobacterium sp.]